MPATTIPLDNAGTFRLGTRTVKRIGSGAMRLSGPKAFGPPKWGSHRKGPMIVAGRS